MENKNIIIILVVIIVILAAVIGFMVLKPMNAKEPTKVKITSNDTLYEGKDLTFKLADLNKTPLSNQKVNITIKNSNGKVVANKTVETNDNGNAKMDLNLKKGKYAVLVAYGGNENYTGNNTTQKLTIKEKVVKATSSEQSSTQSSGGSHIIMGEDGYYYTVDDNGNILENLGQSSKHYPNNPNSVNYPNAEPASRYIDKSR